MCRYLKTKKGVGKKPAGAPPEITPKALGRLLRALHRLQKRANAAKEVTIAMIKAEAGVTATDRTVLKALHANGVWFRKLAERCLLTKDGVKDRLAWATHCTKRSKKAWLAKPHTIIDNKHFQLFMAKRNAGKWCRLI